MYFARRILPAKEKGRRRHGKRKNSRILLTPNRRESEGVTETYIEER